MYCYHCGLEVNEKAALKRIKGLVDCSDVTTQDAKMVYICPRCGHIIKADGDEEDIKSLSRAAHAQVQRANNGFAQGMWMVSVGVILGVISFLFFLLSRKKTAGAYVIRTDQAQFWVFVVLGVAAVILLGFGIYYAISGFAKKRKYLGLLEDINNKTFIQ